MMRVSHSVEEWRARRGTFTDRSIGFVPTMGALHHGHASLVERCREENEIVVVSIFVNPTQFNDPKDLERYPRTLERDLELLRTLGTDEVFVPEAGDMYPRGRRFRIEANHMTGVMEEAHRPGFLQGVTTVVLKLVNLVGADRAYFGEKDYQQLQTIQDMAEEFFIPTKIIACPTIREASGLAASSRNALLSAEGRAKAACIHQALVGSADANAASRVLQRAGLSVDYVEDHWGRRFAAAFLEGVRLIDNVPLAPGH